MTKGGVPQGISPYLPFQLRFSNDDRLITVTLHRLFHHRFLLPSVLALVSVAACATPPAGGGSSTSVTSPGSQGELLNDCSTLVKIRGTTTAAGVAEQEAWIVDRYPGAVRIRQSVAECGGVPVDRITFARNGIRRTVLFDISSFFGKVGKDDLDDLLAG